MLLTHQPISLSLAAPAYNEGEGIGPVVKHWHEFLSAQPDIAQFEIIICNDGSRDRTKEVLDTLTKTYPEVRPIHLPNNQGAAAALTTAIAATTLDWVLLTDSDDQFPIENFSRMLAALRSSQHKAAIGIRKKKDSAFARFGTQASGLVCNLIHGSKMKDFNSAFKLVSGSLLRSLMLEAKGMNYSTEVTSRLLERKITITEVDIEHRLRTTGTSHMKLIRGSIHRFLFVCYLSLRQLLLKLDILRRPSP